MHRDEQMSYSAREKQLVTNCLEGDRSAQRALYDQYSSAMYVVAMRYAKSDQEAEDVLQESFIKVFDRLKSFEGRSSLGSWIKRIVINTALNSQRGKLYMYPMVPVEELDHSASEFTLSNIALEDLIRMIQALPEGCRTIFNLYAIEGYNHNEISEMMEISPGTSKSQYARARQLLQEKIGVYEKTSYEQA